MITLLTGDNSFEIQRTLDKIIADFDGVVERIDGSSLQLNQLPDILMGISLFATARTVIIRGMSENKVIWPVLADWLPRISDDIHLVLVESRIDKRNSAHKALQKVAKLQEFKAWTDRDSYQAEKWVTAEAKAMALSLDTKCVRFLVQRVGVDQWQLFYALQKLALTDEITVDSIKNIIDANPVENVFNLFETATRGNIGGLKQTLTVLENSEDVFRLSSLLCSQIFQLVAISAASSGDNPAKDFAIHPFVIQKMTDLSRRLKKGTIAKIVRIFAEFDDDIKVSRAEPWLLLERALIKTATIC